MGFYGVVVAIDLWSAFMHNFSCPSASGVVMNPLYLSPLYLSCTVLLLLVDEWAVTFVLFIDGINTNLWLI